ncbi:MAG: hypothetical protein WKF90_05310 [Pyrinomonadaceae bacterium]
MNNGTGVNLNNLRLGAVLALPENALSDSGKDFLCGNVPSQDVKLWVITEADRSSTTLLLPEEY